MKKNFVAIAPHRRNMPRRKFADGGASTERCMAEGGDVKDEKPAEGSPALVIMIGHGKVEEEPKKMAIGGSYSDPECKRVGGLEDDYTDPAARRRRLYGDDPMGNMPVAESSTPITPVPGMRPFVPPPAATPPPNNFDPGMPPPVNVPGPAAAPTPAVATAPTTPGPTPPSGVVPPVGPSNRPTEPNSPVVPRGINWAKAGEAASQAESPMGGIAALGGSLLGQYIGNKRLRAKDQALGRQISATDMPMRPGGGINNPVLTPPMPTGLREGGSVTDREGDSLAAKSARERQLGDTGIAAYAKGGKVKGKRPPFGKKKSFPSPTVDDADMDPPPAPKDDGGGDAPIMMAAGGVAKVRHGFPNTVKAPKKMATGGTVRGCGAATKGKGFSGVY